MHAPTLHEMVLRLLLSTLLGGLIGLERETHGRPAGLRTHVLVCLGSTIYTLSSYIIAGDHNDPGRLAAQIVTGVGFLGAGTIIHQGSVVRGLTTAASIWIVAAIGVAAGIGGNALVLATVGAILAFGILNLVPKVERLVSGRQNERTLSVTAQRGTDAMVCVLGLLASHSLKLIALNREEAIDASAQVLITRVAVGPTFDADTFNQELAATECVISYRWA